IMLTSLVEETDMIVGFELGADDYVRKPYSAAELVARTRAALRCRSQLSSQNDRRVLRFGSLEIDAARHRVQVDGQTTHLTLAEYRLLLFLASNFGQAFTRQELLPHVVGEGVFVIDRNIDVHVRNVRKKLGPSAHYIVTVRGIGYRFDAET
ncbi:MAG: response regulator transcription factor, partial [Planctomycetes bacterium]|nr:response regulator transcription factor [Planctomycetota bacterium]